MKIKSLTPWCNLYSTASKYNLCIKESRYRYILLFSSAIFIGLLLISYATYAYHLVLAVAVLTLTVVSFLIATNKPVQLTKLQVTLDEDGIFSIVNNYNKTTGNSLQVKEQFQLLVNSRYSFFGCWLYMSPLPITINKKTPIKYLFIYRDSLSAEDFSRLSQVIRKLKDTTEP